MPQDSDRFLHPPALLLYIQMQKTMKKMTTMKKKKTTTMMKKKMTMTMTKKKMMKKKRIDQGDHPGIQYTSLQMPSLSIFPKEKKLDGVQ